MIDYLKVLAKEQRRALRYAIDLRHARRHLSDSIVKRKTEGISNNYFPGIGVIFVHIPKAAGTSMHRFLSEVERQVTVRPPDAGRPPVHKHATAAAWRDALGADVWDRTLLAYAWCGTPTT